MKFKLIAVDIDGTLLNHEKKLLPQVKESLKQAEEKGMQIALVSGRMPSGVEVIERALGIRCIKVCNAGTYILKGETCIGAEYMPNSVLRGISQRIAEKNNLPLWIFKEKEWFVTGMDEFIRKEIGYVSYQPKLVDAQKLASQWEQSGQRPNKLLVAAEPEKIDEMQRELEGWAWPEIDMARSADVFLEIFPKGVNKGKALQAICRELEIPPSQAIAFGDHELDIPLIEAAGVGVAMGNAIPLLKEKADFVTKTIDEAGVAFALERFLED